MSLGLQTTKRRIASVNSTKKITKAMELVATAKLKTMKKNLLSTAKYAEEVRVMMANIMKNISEESFNKVFDISENTSNNKVFIVVSSSLGLCGGYNYNLFKEMLPFIDKDNDLIVIIGQKGNAFFKNRGYHVDDSFVDMNKDFEYSKIDALIKYILFLYRSNKCNQIYLGYTHFKNQITFIPQVIELFPFKKIESIGNFTRKEMEMIIEPSPELILKSLFPLYLKSIIFSCINESITSEYASRRNAMESATDNAEEIVSKLQIEFNKARQAAITQEITEVVGGANAQK